MNAENTLLAASVTKLELLVRTRFLKLMLSTQNTDKFVSLVDQYLTRFPQSFRLIEAPIQPPSAPQAKPSTKKNTDTSVSQPKGPAKTPTVPKDSAENKDSDKESQQITKTRKLAATDRRTIRRSLPVFVKHALDKTSSPQRTDFLNRLRINPVKALSRSKNTAIIFKHPRLGDITAGAIRLSFDKIECPEAPSSNPIPKPSSKSYKDEGLSELERIRSILAAQDPPTSKATSPSYATIVGEDKSQSTPLADTESGDSAPALKSKEPSEASSESLTQSREEPPSLPIQSTGPIVSGSGFVKTVVKSSPPSKATVVKPKSKHPIVVTEVTTKPSSVPYHPRDDPRIVYLGKSEADLRKILSSPSISHSQRWEAINFLNHQVHKKQTTQEKPPNYVRSPNLHPDAP